MSDENIGEQNLFSPLPLRRDTELGRIVIALEVPDCKCKPPPFCMAGEDGYPEECKGVSLCKDCPLSPCGCVSDVDHPLSIAEWQEILHAYDDRGYSDPPLPDAPAVALTKEAQMAVILARAHAGRAFRHPDDLFTNRDGELEHLSIQGMKRLRQGDVLATYHEGESDEEITEQAHLDRKVDENDRIAVRSREFDRAAARARAKLEGKDDGQ